MLLVTLVRLKTGISSEAAAFLFGVSEAVISRTFESGLLHVYHCFKVLFKPPTLEMMARTCSAKFKSRFKAQGGYIIDCSDLECEIGTDPQVRYATYSDYHNFNGVKFLGAFSFCGAFVFSSHGYNARASDNAVTELSGFLDILERGMTVLADRGFTIFYLLGKIGVTLYIPPFRKKTVNDARIEKTDDYCFSKEDSKLTHKVANLRIHCERGFGRTKHFAIFDRPIPMSMLDLATPMFYVCSMLTNLQLPLVANLNKNLYSDNLIPVNSK